MSDNRNEIGYGKPPKAHRWKKGQSGNPEGSSRKIRGRKRPNKFASFNDILIEEVMRPVRIREGNKATTISAFQATVRSLQIEGLKGNRLASQTYLKLAHDAFQRKADEVREMYGAALDYKDTYPDKARWREARGLPPPLPHPDDVVLDRETGEVFITGPRDAEGRQTLKRLLKAHALVRKAIRLQHQDIEECGHEGLPPDLTQLKTIEGFNDLLLQINGEFAERGWLPRLAGKAKG